MSEESVAVLRARVIKNQKYGEGGLQERVGTKHFRGGAKVFVIDAYWGTCEAVTVVGHHRAGGRFVKLDMAVKHLTDFRADRSYSPTVIDLIKKHYGDRDVYSEEYVDLMLRVLPLWK